jgi:hypothetical protein
LTEQQFVTKYNAMLTSAGSGITHKHGLHSITIQPSGSSGPQYNFADITPSGNLNGGDLTFYKDMIDGLHMKKTDKDTYNKNVLQTKEQVVEIASNYYHEISHTQFKDIYTGITQDQKAMYALSYLSTDQRAKVITNVLVNEDSIDGLSMSDTNGANSQASGVNTAFTDVTTPIQDDHAAGRKYGNFNAPINVGGGWTHGEIGPGLGGSIRGYVGSIGGSKSGFGYETAGGDNAQYTLQHTNVSYN